MTVTPQWGRPDDAEREARLNAMKRRATSLLGVALLVFIAASWFEPHYPWLGYLRATAEASLVGGLADWFAVTALFRHPLGIPIPHTAIVATRKERIGQILGNFVQNHFLSRDVISVNLRRVHPAERGAQWLADREHARQIARQFATGLAKTLDALPQDDVQELVSQVVRNALDDAIRDFIERLQHSPDVIARAEAMKEEWLSDAATVELSRRLWEAIRETVATYAMAGDGAAATPLESGLSEFGGTLLANPALLAEIDDLL